MKFSLSWLKDHLDTQADAATVAEALTRVGLEVEGVSNAADALAPFTIARVLTAERHPQADKLQVLSVDAGNGPMQVVCGAPNARAGLVGIFGPPGAYVPGLDVTLKVAAIRGVESNGMMCSARELQLGEGHDGIVELPGDAPVGVAYAQWAGLDDPVFDVSITPNRQDCMGVRGIARDLAAAGLGTLKPLAVPSIAGEGAAAVAIRTDDPEGCPAFYGRTVAGVANGPSPDWLRRRLEAVDQRSISALVDITNYVMIDLGRPLHVYDMAKLSGALVARRARDGESVEALNGKTYALTPAMTVIADDVGVHDIGGIMGGEHSGVVDATTDIVIECAYFDPAAIARTGQALGLTSDARQRFERGVDPAFLDDGLAIATGLVLDLCGGRPSEVIRAGAPPVTPRTVAFDPARTPALGGIDVPADRQRAILESLGFGVGGDWTVTVPSWRRDVDGTADLVEEVVRIAGLDSVPSTPLARAEGVAKPTASDAQLVERRIRRAAAARGLHEAVTWSFISEEEARPFGGGAWTLANPISESLKVMRPSLLPGLVAAAQRNRARGEDAVRLFEIGRRYAADAEHPTLGFVRSVDEVGLGGREPGGWAAAKADALALIAAVSGRDLAQRLRVEAPASPWYHPGRSGVLKLGARPVAEFGELHPELLRAAGLRHAACAGELFLDALTLRRAGKKPAYAPNPLQPVKRDFAFVLPEDKPAAQLDLAIRKADKLVEDVTFFDLFRLPSGERSLALRVTLQPAQASFTDAELKAISDRIVAAAEKAGASLRG
ncbi:phenylalanine--tRNA ligase subunit beta [Sphingomonas quercus]|uniref:Phenylalanine--tRNA ligase beta subunit n=1 Tax=Sphingomonas quercus TaxID=2842451 RepID=A0ABS6BFE1_9SPHN|nr:phenylalanine--tRNA ligase subunit beta [Sphingomonas quercus]